MGTIRENRSKFRSVVDKLTLQIYNGDLESGRPMYSRQELCRRFSISPMTAHRVQAELLKLGLVSPCAGQKFMISAPRICSATGFEPLRRIITIGGRNAIGPGTLIGEEIMTGIDEECARHGLEHVVEYVNLLENQTGFINTHRQLQADEGLSLFMGPSLLPEVVSLLMTPNIRVSLVNESMPGHVSVLIDNRHCMQSLLKALRTRGCRRIIRAGYFYSYSPSLNEAETLEAFEDICSAEGLEYRLCISGNYRELAQLCDEWRADAVVFLDAVSGCRFLRSYAGSLSRLPVVAAGPCIHHPELSEYSRMIAYEPDFQEMGRASVRQLLEYKTPFQAVRNIRVKGIIGNQEQVQ